MKSKKRKAKSKTVTVWLSEDVIESYKRVAKLTNLSVNKVFNVVIALYLEGVKSK